MTTIKLFYNRQDKAYMADEVGAAWSLEPYGKNTEYYQGETVEEAEFILPDGYRLGETIYGESAIFCGDYYCTLITDGNDIPRICTPEHTVHGLPLKRVAAVILGRKGGSAKSDAKTAAARANAKKPRPRKLETTTGLSLNVQKDGKPRILRLVNEGMSQYRLMVCYPDGQQVRAKYQPKKGDGFPDIQFLAAKNGFEVVDIQAFGK